MAHPSGATFVLDPPYSGERPPYVLDVAPSPDGTRLAALYSLRNQPTKDELRIRVWTLADRTFRNVPAPAGASEALCWPTADTLVVGGSGEVHLVSVEDGAAVAVRWPGFTPIRAVAAVPGRAEAVVYTGQLGVLDLATRKARVGERKTHELVHAAVVSPDGQLVATRAAEPFVRVFRRKGGAQEHRIHSAGSTGVAFTPDGRWLAVGADADDRIAVIDLSTPGLAPSRHIEGAAGVHSLAISADGTILAGLGGQSRGPQVLRAWDWATGAQRCERSWPGESVQRPFFVGSTLYAPAHLEGPILAFDAGSGALG